MENGFREGKFQFVALFKSTQPGSDYHVIARPFRAVAISWYNVSVLRAVKTMHNLQMKLYIS